jgi:thioredoxin reductase
MGVDVEWMPGGEGDFKPDPASLTAIRKAGVVWREGAVLKEIKGERVVEAAVCDIGGRTEEVAVDGVSIIRPMPFFADSGLKTDSGSCVTTDRSQRITCRACLSPEISPAAGEGAFAALQALRHLRTRT